MKFQLFILALTLTSCLAADEVTWKSYFGDACTWRNALNSNLKQLSPNGQQIFTQILLDLQAYTGAAIQPHFDFLSSKYGEQMASVNASADGAHLRTVGGILGWRAGPTRGLGVLQDSCQRQTKVREAVAQMTLENQIVMKAAIADIQNGLLNVYKPVASIVYLKDRYLFDALAANENKETLLALRKLFGQ